MAKKIIVVLAQLVRVEKSVTVEVPDDFDTGDEQLTSNLCHTLYDEDDGAGYTDDCSWGAEEGTHGLFFNLTEKEKKVAPEYKASFDDGEITLTRLPAKKKTGKGSKKSR